jgi:hypothetical protein
VLRVERLIAADGVPAIYCEDYIPLSLIKKKRLCGGGAWKSDLLVFEAVLRS